MAKGKFWLYISIIASVGLGFRLWLAFGVAYNQGFAWDIAAFGNWMDNIRQNGLSPYGPDLGFNYPPAFADLMVGIMGFAGILGVEPISIIKLLGILPDVAISFVLALAGRKWFTEKQGLLAAALYLLIPITWYDSAIWGQVDSLSALPMLLAVWLMIDKKPEWSFVLFAVAVLTKPQGALIIFVLLPLLIAQIRDKNYRWWRLLTAGGSAFATFLLIAVPWDLESYAPRDLASIPVVGDLAGLVGQYIYNANYFHVVTANAYNIWALAGNIPLAHQIQDNKVIWIGDDYEVLGINAQLLGLGLFLLIAMSVAVVIFLKNKPAVALNGLALLLVAFFVLPTRVHERYLVQAFAILALLWAGKLWQQLSLVVLSVANTLNLHAILASDLRVENMNVGKENTSETMALGIQDVQPFQGSGPEYFGLSWFRTEDHIAREEWMVLLIIGIHLAALFLIKVQFFQAAGILKGKTHVAR